MLRLAVDIYQAGAQLAQQVRMRRPPVYPRGIATFATQLTALRDGNVNNPVAALAAMQQLALPGVDLADLETKDKQGVDVSAALAALHAIEASKTNG